MRIAILSDVHSNYTALRRVYEVARDLGCEKFVCLGDVIGYGADPNPCCDLLRRTTEATLLGNHDAAVIGNMDVEYYYEAARKALLWTRQMLSTDNFRWLYTRPYTWRMDDYYFYHAAPIAPSGFYYAVTERVAVKHLAVFDRLGEFNFVGHSHLTNTYMLSPGGVEDRTGRPVRSVPGRKWIINVGSVGQPRDRDPRACFGMLDTRQGLFEHIRVEYDIDEAAAHIAQAGLSERFAQRLYEGL